MLIGLAIERVKLVPLCGQFKNLLVSLFDSELFIALHCGLRRIVKSREKVYLVGDLYLVYFKQIRLDKLD